jgi:hypothetical protein
MFNISQFFHFGYNLGKRGEKIALTAACFPDLGLCVALAPRA